MRSLKNIVEGIGLPVAYDHFNQPIDPPFVVFRRYSQDNFGADDVVYKKIDNYYVELYTKYKNPTLEHRLEGIFDINEIFYNVESEDYIDEEKMYEIIYSINFDEKEISIITEHDIELLAEGNIYEGGN